MTKIKSYSRFIQLLVSEIKYSFGSELESDIIIQKLKDNTYHIKQNIFHIVINFIKILL